MNLERLKELARLAQQGDAGEERLRKLPQDEYKIARTVGRMWRLRQVLLREPRPEAIERQQDRRKALDQLAGQLAVAVGMSLALAYARDLGVEV